MTHPVSLALVVPGLPHPLLAPEQNEGWMRLRQAFDLARKEIGAAKPDLLLIYSTMWPSIIGHQIQAQPEPEWVHVDELFHDLGSIPYKLRIDSEFAHALCSSSGERGLSARTIAYQGFPIDTGSVVALKLLNPDNRLPAVIVSSNVYADRAETVVFGKAAVDALEREGKSCAAIAVSTLSNRLFTRFIPPSEDHIHSTKDDEWNRKVLEFLADGRLEDVAQLSRELHQQIRVPKVVNFKAFWWLSAVAGQHNRFAGKLHGYAALHGAGGAVVSLRPSASGVGDKEFDEEDIEYYSGEREVLAAGGQPLVAPEPAADGAQPERVPLFEAPDGEPRAAVRAQRAPKPVGPYPHARRVGDLLFLSGIGPRRARDNGIAGGAIHDHQGEPQQYDIYAQTEQVIANVRAVLEAAGSSLTQVVDVTVFLVDMERDFARFNQAYTKHMGGIGAARTTVAVRALPTPIAVEFKVIALAGSA